MTPNERAMQLEQRLIDFAVIIVDICDLLPTNAAGRHFGGQLVRSGSAPALLYAEARGAESSKDFRHKMSIALKELREAHVTQRIIQRSSKLRPKNFDLSKSIDENNQLISIFVAAVKSIDQKIKDQKQS